MHEPATPRRHPRLRSCRAAPVLHPSRRRTGDDPGRRQLPDQGAGRARRPAAIHSQATTGGTHRNRPGACFRSVGAFRILAESYEQARTGGQGTLSISTIPTFAANWFALHLGSFHVAHPSIAVRLETSNRMVDFAQENIDIGIRTGGKGVWPGLVSHRLFMADFTPMLSPSLAAKIGKVEEPADLLKLPILDAGDPWWAAWFDLAGIDARENLVARTRSQLGSQAFEGRAAVAGVGVAILTRELFAAELASGSLIQPFEIVGNDGHAYWMVYQEARRNAPKIRAFRDWMLTEVGASTGAAT